jgi:hypothetical protein
MHTPRRHRCTGSTPCSWANARLARSEAAIIGRSSFQRQTIFTLSKSSETPRGGLGGVEQGGRVMEQATDNNGPMASAASPCRSSTCSSSDGEGGGEEGKEVQRGNYDDRDDALLAGLISKHRALSQQGRQQPQQQPQQPQAAGVVATGEGQWGSPQKSFTNVRLSSRSSDGDLEERAACGAPLRENPGEPTSPGRDEGRKRVGSVLADFHAGEAARARVAGGSARSARSPRDSGEHGGEQGGADHVHAAHLPWSSKVRVVVPRPRAMSRTLPGPAREC